METEIGGIQLPASLDRTYPRKDGSMSLTFLTQELTIAEKVRIMQYLDKFGWLLFKEDKKEFDEKEIPKDKTDYDEGKSPSLRLRNVIYIFWNQYKKAEHPDFEAYYRMEMEKLINAYKDKLT